MVNNKKGQITFDGLMMGFVLIIVYVSLLPVLNEFITIGLGASTGMTAVILTLIPLFILIAIIRSIWGYSSFVQG